jgi:hypothetical protein
MEDAKIATYDEIVNHGGSIPEAKYYIWQKHLDIEAMKVLKSKGRKNFIDFCDPVWWFQPELMSDILDVADGFIFGTQALMDDYLKDILAPGFPMAVVPDGLLPEVYPLKREHNDVSPIRFIWFGVAANRCALYSALPTLDRLSALGRKIELTIFDDKPGKTFTEAAYPISYIPWSLKQENEVISSCDIALLPPYPGPWGKLKSNNKPMLASACGLPVTDGNDIGELLALCNSVIRKEKTIIPPDNWHTKYSAKMLEEFICTASCIY